MPFTRCPKCRRVQRIEARVLEKEMGCLNPHCDKLFVAKDYRLHSNTMSRMVFLGVIVFAAYLAVHWYQSNAEWLNLASRTAAR